ncbi:polysaccharide deacetylase family protein [Actinoplanes friuliensis]|jgi:peptidoglycan/xylan/chitin deacetylase (PgdA/CDA1 family)|uniref:Putative polysaccharide deacetylase n=1 Tax=Actinoplanes friuliensis DSM 7358 TaxID=1246995 RepID=U5W9X2_9ACTN|nr:polysaccharide deacetylase family protein [Actinoplanes friuliensis]AGZ45939.1 putative polysaccharide deacetylase [Actinoplanes friuliensis DSM 7358]
MRRPRAVLAVTLGFVLMTGAGIGVSYAQSVSVPAKPTAGVAGPKPRPPAQNYRIQRTTGTKSVGLTFDDGPDPVNTPKLLDLLKKYNVKATFCLVGHRVRDNKALVKRIAAEGHTLCNHSWQHLEDLRERDDAYAFRDLEATNEQLHKAAPGAKIKYFRAPYGNFSPRLTQFAAKLGMTALSWNVDDQCYLTAEYGKGAAMRKRMFDIVKRDTRPGSIILSHENLKPHTVAAYETILPWLKQNFTLVAL